MKNLELINCDTDSITVCKPDQSPWTKEETKSFLDELNDQFPDLIKFEDDGYFPTIIVLKAKNYLLWDGKKKKTKGSALKSSTKSIALKEMLNEILESIISEKYNYTEIFNKYIKEAMNVKDIKRWASKKTLTEKVKESERTNESKIRDALVGSEYSEGDKFYVFFKEDSSLCLVENFNGDYDKMHLVKQVWNTAKILNTIIPEETFPKYHLKKNKELLEALCNER